jgi:hypothetical protein
LWNKILLNWFSTILSESINSLKQQATIIYSNPLLFIFVAAWRKAWQKTGNFFLFLVSVVHLHIKEDSSKRLAPKVEKNLTIDSKLTILVSPASLSDQDMASRSPSGILIVLINHGYHGTKNC